MRVAVCILSFIGAAWLSAPLYAQQWPRRSTQNALELTLSARDGQFASALAAYRLHGIGRKKRLQAGYGLRLTSYYAKNQQFVTAPARLTSGKTGPTVIFTENIPANFDTLSLASAQINWLNAAVFLQYAVLPRLEVGFNIDVIGFSVGSRQIGAFTARESDNPLVHGTIQGARPTVFNLLLTSDNDIGSLNSEFFARYRLAEKWGVKAGYTFLFAEYTTDRKLAFDNDRFRKKAGLFMLGVTYQLGK